MQLGIKDNRPCLKQCVMNFVLEHFVFVEQTVLPEYRVPNFPSPIASYEEDSCLDKDY